MTGVEGIRHPIGVAAERTGLSQDVLRVWERRYAAVQPSRADGNQRMYSDADIERLTLLKRATDAGRMIGKIAELSTEALAALVRDDDAARAGREREEEAAEPHIHASGSDLDAALSFTRDLDAARLEVLLRRMAVALGAHEFVDGFLSPYLQRIGEEWHAGRLSPAQEHLGTATVERVISGMISNLALADDAPVLAVAGPAGDRHELGGLMVAATAAAEGWGVLYLGADLPAADIASAAIAGRARGVGMSVVFVDDPVRMLGELRALRALLPTTIPLLVGGAGVLKLGEEVESLDIRLLPDRAALRAVLRSWSRSG